MIAPEVVEIVCQQNAWDINGILLVKMPQCSVPECSNQGGHKFPVDKKLYWEWVNAIPRRDPSKKDQQWIPGKAARVCHKHFSEEDYVIWNCMGSRASKKQLKRGVVPHIFNVNRKGSDQQKKKDTSDHVPLKTKVEEVQMGSSRIIVLKRDSENQETCNDSHSRQEVERALKDSSLSTLHSEKPQPSQPIKTGKPQCEKIQAMSAPSKKPSNPPAMSQLETKSPERQELTEADKKIIERMLQHTRVPLPEGWIATEFDEYRDVMNVENMKVLRCIRIYKKTLRSVAIYIGGGHFAEWGDQNFFLDMPFLDVVNDIQAVILCQGITDPTLQELTGKNFYREQGMTYDQKPESRLRSYACSRGGSLTICEACRSVLSDLKIQYLLKQNTV